MFLSYITDKSNSYKIIKLFNSQKREVCSYCSVDIVPDEMWLMFMKLFGCEIRKIVLTDDEMEHLKDETLLKEED